MFGTYTRSGRNLLTIQYGTDDFTHWNVQEPNPGQVTVDYLTASDLQPAVVSVYEGS